jgi:hypothetical protein
MGSRSIRASVVASLVAFGLLTPVPSGMAAVCEAGAEALGPGAVHLGDFTSGYEVGSVFYAAKEGTSATAVVRVSPGDCTGPQVQGHYTTAGGTAVEGVDYQDRTGSTTTICDDAHYEQFCGSTPRTYPVAIPVEANAGAEAAVESFSFSLTGGSLGVEPPSSSPVHSIDIHGAPRAALEPGVPGYSKSETYIKMRIPVFLAGTSESGSVGYTLSPDPAAPAMVGEDIQDLTGGTVTVGSSRLAFIDLGLVNDTLSEPPESVIVTLTGGPGIAVADPSSIRFTIEDNEESDPPTSRLHHPRHKWRYKKSDYRIREVHVFTHDNPGGAGVTAAQFALRRNLKNGDCQWLARKGWKQGDCQNREWLPTQWDPVGELWRYRPKQLKSSVATKIKNYTAFSRAIDGAGNVERDFKEKRNANTFEVKRSRKGR